MKNILFLLLVVTATYSQDLPVQTSAAFDQSNNIRHYLNRVASEITLNSLAGIHRIEDWQEQRPERQKQMLEMLSLVDVPLDEPRPSLNVTIVDSIQRETHRIYKLHYESLPNLYVPADLYLPKTISELRPAILYLCGHARTQKVHYQAHARRFAELGFVCLIVETIQWGEVRGEHWGCYANGWFHWYSRGYTPAGVEVWNAMRGLDLLTQRPEVDAERLGVTGISGGGAQSWFVAAADERIKAVAPVCGASTVKAHVHTRTVDGHCDCMMPINTYGWDFADVAALIAPRPLLIAQANRDGLNTIESVRDIYYDLDHIYNLYDASDVLSLVETPGGHSYHKTSRQKIFSFFIKHLMDRDIPYTEIDDVDESESAQLSADELRVFSNGPLPDDRTTRIQDEFIQLPPAPEIQTEGEWKKVHDRIVSELHKKTFAAFPEPVPLQPRLEFRTLDGGPYGKNVYSFVSEADWRLKVDIRYRQPRHQTSGLMIVLRNAGESRWDSEGFISGLSDDWNIAYVELRGVGEAGWAPEMQWHVRRAAAWTGRTVASMQVYDLLRVIEFVKTLQGVDPRKIGIAARDEMGVVALYSALVDGDVHLLILQHPPDTQDVPSSPDGRGPAIEMLNCLQITDVYQLPALIYPTKTCFVETMPAKFEWAVDVNNRLGRTETIRTVADISEFKN